MLRAFFLVISLLILSIFLQISIDMEKKPAAPVFETPERFLIEMLGSLKITLADLLWIRVDKYFHAYEPGKEEHHRHEEEEETESDEFEKISEVMPLLRVITWLDPHFVQAYQIGGWHLAFNLNKLVEAEKFLKEGLSFNPERYEIHAEMGRFYLLKKDQPLEAGEYLKQALEGKVADIGEKKELYILLAVSYERSGRLDESLKVWRKASEINPEDVIIRSRIEELEKRTHTP